MKRRFLLGLTLLGSLAVALGLGLMSVPHKFEEGKTMSASGMNANLAAVYASIRAASDSLEASRLVHMDFKDRLDEVFPATGSASSLPDGLSLQQVRADEAHAGGTVELTLRFDPGTRARPNLRLDGSGHERAFALAPGASATVTAAPASTSTSSTAPPSASATS